MNVGIKQERDYICEMVKAYDFLHKIKGRELFTFKVNNRKFEIKEIT